MTGIWLWYALWRLTILNTCTEYIILSNKNDCTIYEAKGNVSSHKLKLTKLRERSFSPLFTTTVLRRTQLGFIIFSGITLLFFIHFIFVKLTVLIWVTPRINSYRLNTCRHLSKVIKLYKCVFVYTLCTKKFENNFPGIFMSVI